MPDWQPDWSDVGFGHAEAAAAAEVCRSAARRVAELGERRNALGADAVVEWHGRFRDDFDRDFAAQSRRSARLVAQLLAQADRIDAAAAEATQLQTARQRDRRRWRDELRAEDAAEETVDG